MSIPTFQSNKKQRWFKIGEDVFESKTLSIQFNIDTTSNNFGYAKMIHQGPQTIDITASVEYNTFNSDYFFNLFEKSRTGNYASDYKFTISSPDFVANGCVIKSITSDPSTNSIVMDIRSDSSKIKQLDERRDEIIDSILDETSKNKNI